MQQTSELYKKLLQDPRVYTETIVKIDGVTYDKTDLVKMKTTGSVFSGDDFEVGACVARKISLTIMKPSRTIPAMAKIEPFVMLTNGTETSEPIAKGKFFIDTRQAEDIDSESDALTIDGFCAMLKTENDCPVDGLNWPAKDIDVIRLIAADIGVEVDPRTEAEITLGYDIQLPASYSEREVLSGIGAMYGGSFIMSDLGKLLFLRINGIPEEENTLIAENGDAITFGGVEIIVS